MKTKRISHGKQILTATEAAAISNISNAAKTAEFVGQMLCPVDSGDLKSTTYSEDDGMGHANFGTGGDAPSGRWVNYHIFVEWGTSKMDPRSYYRPGLDAGRQELKGGMEIKQG